MDGKCSNKPFLALMQTTKAIQDRIRLEMAKNNISITEFSVLEVLYLKGKQTIQQIGNSILISSGSMTYVIDKLEQKGYLNRNACREDRRVIHITLSDLGLQLMETIMPIHQDLVNNMFASLNYEEEQSFVKLLKKVMKTVEAAASS
ncbi:MarR family winged helix-turn-helix transcriptional regulator [Neobacillus sp. LXY-4]|uniref:MarR family winged helix-turn-helix transcriptional regulator n=1 Tax=Neobacillus sp. LXY-4 TaxID=3379826 RepID=UPI003EE39B58